MMSRQLCGVAAVCLLAPYAATLAQPAALTPDNQITPPKPVFFAPLFEGGVRKNRGISIPVNLGLAPERRIAVGYTAWNSYSNPGLLVCADRNRSCELEYQADHTGNLLFADFNLPILDRWELGIGLATFSMGNVAGWSPVHQLVSDDILRTFHEDILQENSLPELSNAPDGRQVFAMTDLAGRRLELESEHNYFTPLRIDLTRYLVLRATDKAQIALNAGMHLSHPLESTFARGIDFGISANLVHSRRITPNLASTWHVQVARFRQDVHVVNQASPFHGDELERSQYAFSWGLRFAGTFAGAAPCSVSLSQLSNSAHFDKERFWTWDRTVFEGGNNLRGAILGANDFGVVSFACEYRGRRMQVALAEDIGGFSQFLSQDGSGTSYDPDFMVSVSVSWSPGRGESAQMPIP